MAVHTVVANHEWILGALVRDDGNVSPSFSTFLFSISHTHMRALTRQQALDLSSVSNVAHAIELQLAHAPDAYSEYLQSLLYLLFVPSENTGGVHAWMSKNVRLR